MSSEKQHFKWVVKFHVAVVIGGFPIQMYRTWLYQMSKVYQKHILFAIMDLCTKGTELRYQNFDRNRYQDFFHDTKFSETETET